uniref:MULE transposase domain-containing protein n=1 Tax=Tanacetum cinerariifolium TaxID=118510 RepID=A0A6L2JZ07_TANCI|nr:hypothetical protein [Tanacetum cinerariifolium]
MRNLPENHPNVEDPNVLLEFLPEDREDVLPEVSDPNVVMEEVTECMRTPRATLYEQNKTPGGSIYWEPHVEGIPIPVEGAYYDTIDEALDMYTKYAKMVGFEIKKGGKRLTKSGAVQHKYIYCNKEGVPKGIDNHGKCVTLGSGKLLHKDTKSYTWLLNAFMTAFSHEPTMIVTDQDGAMKRAIEAVFKKAKHRLCMTTSRSESENSFFKSFTSPGATLVSFMMSYESAMERQRYRQETLVFTTIDAAPKCETKLEIERHATRVYTRTIFLLV